MYPEVKKVQKLAAIIMKSAPPEFVPSNIKIPVVSSLGIKAVIKLGEIDYSRHSEDQDANLFLNCHHGYQSLDPTGIREPQEEAEQVSYSFRSQHEPKDYRLPNK